MQEEWCDPGFVVERSSEGEAINFEECKKQGERGRKQVFSLSPIGHCIRWGIVHFG